jgi:acetyl esterase/lipase
MHLRNAAVAFVVISALFTMNANAAPTTRPTEAQVFRLWNERAPRSTGDKEADIPTITAFMPDPAIANGCAVVVCPGGGYAGLAMDYEGTDVAKWLAEHGIAAFVLKYRVQPYGQPAPLLDGQRAIRYIRFNSKAWGLDWKRIGIIGFSAGGHVASSVGTHWDPYIPGSPDAINGQSCRPDFMILVYPVITMKDKITDAGSKRNLLGDHPPQKLVDVYSNELQVKDDTPPAFIVASKVDKIVPVKNSELFYSALKYHSAKDKIASELLELPTGEHGFGLAKNDPAVGIWTDRCLAWMDKSGFVKKK